DLGHKFRRVDLSFDPRGFSSSGPRVCLSHWSRKRGPLHQPQPDHPPQPGAIAGEQLLQGVGVPGAGAAQQLIARIRILVAVVPTKNITAARVCASTGRGKFSRRRSRAELSYKLGKLFLITFEAALFACVLITMDYRDRLHWLLLYTALLVYGILLGGILTLGAYIKYSTQGILKAIDALRHSNERS